ncbi:hypothetical protein GCM10010873_35530 [Cypionkella aquatica]|uniref:Lipid/polyisoprenoid-binding YceI-like domain-containing protein n=1 Tax=Cypionkella aquatica TaxID=1756042 RepID=A0AA37X035_9RHOB|nr:hypothetical protein [Cypionkella aquatica]GLS87393.1 hypothetical protein GCM10010873_23670 [Cypionkella aquatica]GLS88579.1 hypothetical protein GCM10010873_35530 [Cypionkella aquatica]
MRLAPALAVLLWVAGAAAAQETEALPPGYPPKLGGAAGQLGDTSVAWEFFDFSIGAFDASAWVDRDYNSGTVRLHLMGYAPGKPDDTRNRLLAQGDFGKAFHTGAAEMPLVEVLQGSDVDGPKLTSKGQRAEIVVESIGPLPENSYLRHVTGRLTARVCPQDWPLKSCQTIALQFETDVQMGSAVAVTP